MPSDRLMQPQLDLFQSSHGDALRNAIKTLYSAFSDCRLDDTFACCPHCFTDDDVAYLKNTPLDQFSHQDIAFITADAIYTLGTAKDFNYFLPRILETWAYHAHYMEFIIPGKMKLARDEGWSPAQADAVVGFVRVFFRAANSLANNTLFYYELSDGIASELERVFPEVKGQVGIDLREDADTR